MDDRPFNILSICTGGGGLDEGAHIALSSLGYAPRTVCCVERDAFACAVLGNAMEAGLMDAAAVWSDLRTFDGRPWRGIVHGVVAGIPCQGNSLAGKRLLADDERDLWSDTARILREIQPEWFLLENVYGFMVPDRKGGREAPIRRVLRELAEMGWDAEWCVLPASSVGASHRRERVFVLAHRVGSRAGDQPRADRGLQRQHADAHATEALRPAHGEVGAGRLGAGRGDVADDERGGQLARVGDDDARQLDAAGCGEVVADRTGGGLGECGHEPHAGKRGDRGHADSVDAALVHAERAQPGSGVEGDEGGPRLGRGGHPDAGGAVDDAARDGGAGPHGEGWSGRGVCAAGSQLADAERSGLRGLGLCKAPSTDAECTGLANAGRELPQGIDPAGTERWPTGRGGGGVVGVAASGDVGGIERSGVDAGTEADGGRAINHNVTHRPGISVARAAILPLFAPGPTDPRWRDIIALAPETQPAVRELADGLATTRREWLRVLGNGVVPLQAAAAIRALWDAMEGDRR